MTKLEIFCDAGLAGLMRAAEALNIGGFIAFAMAASFCAGAYVATRIAESVAGRWVK